MKIKVRRYNKLTKKMSYHKELLIELGKHFLDELENYSEPMMWAGLKDKHGKEIYEGDIIEITEYDILKQECYSYVKEVKWNKLIARFEPEFHLGMKRLSNNGNRSVKEEKDCPWEIKVIGNIYKNSELLKNETNE